MSVHHEQIGWLEFDLTAQSLPPGAEPGCSIPIALYVDKRGNVVWRQIRPGVQIIPRVGVPFEQIRSLPRDFCKTLTLDEFLRITDEWEQTDDRRCQLIEKRIKHGSRIGEEDAEFKNLQRLYDLRRAYLRWRRTGDANSPLIDEAMLRRLREQDEGEARAK